MAWSDGEFPQIEWRVIRARRRVGYGWVIQNGYWAPVQNAWSGRRLRVFSVLYEEEHSTRKAAEQAMHGWASRQTPKGR